MSFGQHIIEHTVCKGETLESIARQYGISTSDITSLNPSAARFLYVGQKLQIKTVPATDSSTATEFVSTPEPAVPSTYVAEEHTTPVPAQTIVQYVKSEYPKFKFSGYFQAGFDLSNNPLTDKVEMGVTGPYGLGFNLLFTEHFGIGTALEYKWTRGESSQRYSGKTHDYISTNHYLGAPILVSVHSDDSFGFGLRAGMYLGGHLGGRTREKVDNKTIGKSSNGRLKALVYGPEVDIIIYGVSLRYRASFTKDSENALHTIGFGFWF